MHVISVIVGLVGIGTLIAATVAGQSNLVFGFTREHLLFCSIIVFLVAIWLQIATIHHMMLEKRGEVV
ncbi:hypothetical protein K2Y00_01845 [Patescibacteria group bacterium]|nr:hypothetical protein [Patescibacteria group bacterium]